MKLSDAEYRLRTFPPQLQKYLIKGEDPSRAVALQRHWLTIAEPVGTAVLGLILLLFVALMGGNNYPALTNALILIELLAIGRAGYFIYKRRKEWWIVTNQRLISLSGIWTRKVAFMPVKKLNDMTLSRGVFGQLFGYGDFIIDQAQGGKNPLGKLDMIEHFDHHYQYIFGEFLVEGAKSDAKQAATATATTQEPLTPAHGAFSTQDLPLTLAEDDPTASYATPRDKGVIGRIRAARSGQAASERTYVEAGSEDRTYDLRLHRPQSTTRLGKLREVFDPSVQRQDNTGYGPHVVASTRPNEQSRISPGVQRNPTGKIGEFIHHQDDQPTHRLYSSEPRPKQ